MASRVLNESAGVAVPTEIDLALDRTHLAYERTLMAWIRTAATLISLGFAIYKFFDYLRQSTPEAPPDRMFGVREFSLAIILIGIISALIATLQHWHRVKSIKQRFAYDLPHSLALMLAGLISGFGIIALLAVLFRQ